MRPHGPWWIQVSREVYRDPWIVVQRDEVIRPDGAPGSHCLIHLKAGVCILAIDDQEVVHLTDEFHYAVGRQSLEGVSGGIESGEDARITAARELREELGIEAAHWTDLGTIDPFTSIVLSPTRLYLARQLKFVGADPEGTEQIRHVPVPLDEAVRMVQDGRITHGPTCIALLRAALAKAPIAG